MSSLATQTSSSKTESFAALFEESLKRAEMRSGEVITAEVVRIEHNHVVVNAGLKSEAYVPLAEFMNDQGEPVDQAGPSNPVQVMGWEDVPAAALVAGAATVVAAGATACCKAVTSLAGAGASTAVLAGGVLTTAGRRVAGCRQKRSYSRLALR